MKPLISVIIPVYNVEKYVDECIDSVLKQSYRNLEIILVDDGSTDTSGERCDDYAKKDSRIIVLHKENGGLSDARNKAIDMCKGEYISFVDSDDIVSHHFIEFFWKTIEKEKSDIVSLKITAKFWDGIDEKPTFKEDNDFTIKSYDSVEALRLLLYQKVPTGMPHRIYKASLFEGIRFPKGLVYEDLATAYKLFIKAHKISFIDSELYGYRLRTDSTIRRKFKRDKLSCIDISREMCETIINNYPELTCAVASRAFAANSSVFLQAPYNEFDAINMLWNEMKRYRGYLLKDRSGLIRKKNLMCARLMIFGKRVTHWLGKKFGQKGSMHP